MRAKLFLALVLSAAILSACATQRVTTAFEPPGFGWVCGTDSPFSFSLTFAFTLLQTPVVGTTSDTFSVPVHSLVGAVSALPGSRGAR
jgi:hypothetical protein